MEGFPQSGLVMVQDWLVVKAGGVIKCQDKGFLMVGHVIEDQSIRKTELLTYPSAYPLSKAREGTQEQISFSLHR